MPTTRFYFEKKTKVVFVSQQKQEFSSFVHKYPPSFVTFPEGRGVHGLQMIPVSLVEYYSDVSCYLRRRVSA
jgi:hypothetical protein